MLNVISEYIVAGTDKYQGYTGGTYVENVISFEPYESEITLIPPETTVVSEEAKQKAVMFLVILLNHLEEVSSSSMDGGMLCSSGWLWHSKNSEIRILHHRGNLSSSDRGVR